MTLIETRHLYELGIGLIGAHLLAATLLTDDARLWTRDQRLGTAASSLGLAAGPRLNPPGLTR